MDRRPGAEHAAEEAIELMERGEDESKKRENNLERQQSQRPESPNLRKINIEEIEEVFKKGNFKRGFSMFDENKDGQIDIRELKRMISHMGNSIPNDVAQKILSMSDTNNDGYLDYHEFVRMVNNPQFSVLFGKYLNSYVKALVPKRTYVAKDADVFDSVSIEDTQDGRFEEQYSCWPPPITMMLISLTEIILFIIDDVKFDAKSGTGPMATALMYNPHRRYEAWRFLTYMFVHIGYTHLCVNLIIQIVLGIPLEMVHGGWRVIIIYLMGVIAGSLATSITDPNVYLAGASGGVYSLITAHIASVIMNWKEMTVPLLQISIFTVITIGDFGTAIYNRYYLKLEDHIGYVAHFAGAFAGLLVGIFILRNIEKNSCEKKLWWIALITFCIFVIIAVVFNIAYPSYFPPQY